MPFLILLALTGCLHGAMSEPVPAGGLLPPGTAAIEFTITTDVAAVVRADPGETPWPTMRWTLGSADGRLHRLRVPCAEDVPMTIRIRGAPLGAATTPWSDTRIARFRIRRATAAHYPRVFTHWWPYGAHIPGAPPAGDMTAAKIARLGLASFGRSQGDVALIAQARAINPRVVATIQHYATYGGPAVDVFAARTQQVGDPLYNSLVHRADGSIFHYYSQDAVFNFTNPHVRAHLIDWSRRQWLEDCLVYDGIYMDNVWPRVFGPGLDAVDLDRDGIADSRAAREAAYEDGLKAFLSGLRAALPGAVIVGNGPWGRGDRDLRGQPTTWNAWMDGTLYEDDLRELAHDTYWDTWPALVAQVRSWENGKAPPFTFLPYKLDDGATDADDAYGKWQQTRFSVCATLQTEAMVMFNGWGFYSWFDEYDAPLGQPLASGAPLPGQPQVWMRPFEGGIAMVNLGSSTAQVNLGGSFRALTGTQDPSVNDGQVRSTLAIAARDGRILLRTASAPQVAPLADRTGRVGEPMTVVVDIADAQSAATSLSVAAVSAETGVVPAQAMAWGGSGSRRVLTLTPAAAGSTTVTVTVGDGAMTRSRPFAVTAIAANRAPVAPAQSIAMTIGGTRQITLGGSDADGDPLAWEIVAGPGHGVLSGAGSTWSYAPASAYLGSDGFTFRVGDGQTWSPVATVAIRVDPPSPGGGLPVPWATRDIGTVAATGGAAFADGRWTVRGSGADIWGTADEFRCVHQSLAGDGDIIARVVSQTATHPWAKAGVMLRGGFGAGDVHAQMVATPGNGNAFQRRTIPAGGSHHTAGGPGTTRPWLKLSRRGAVVSGYESADGVTWRLVGSATIPLAAIAQACLVVTSHRDGTLSTAVFDQVVVIPAGSG